MKKKRNLCVRERERARERESLQQQQVRKGKRSSREGSGRGMGCCWTEKRASRQGLLYLAQQRQEPRRSIWWQTQIGQTTPGTLLSWYPPFRECLQRQQPLASARQSPLSLRQSVRQSQSLGPLHLVFTQLFGPLLYVPFACTHLRIPTYTHNQPTVHTPIHTYIHTYRL
jgi:hypothetical protein